MSINAIVVAGVCGCGKSSFAKRLAESLKFTFIEADDFHSVEAKIKMSQGLALTDLDREPWLKRLNLELKAKKPAILACSALKSEYRALLNQDIELLFIWLDISPELAAKRVGERNAHFMPSSLVASQFAIACEPKQGLILNADNELKVLVEQSLDFINSL